jgi:hypothetical protein
VQLSIFAVVPIYPSRDSVLLGILVE